MKRKYQDELDVEDEDVKNMLNDNQVSLNDDIDTDDDDELNDEMSDEDEDEENEKNTGIKTIFFFTFYIYVFKEELENIYARNKIINF
ncbi:hypothetical protein BCR36DRAFT_105957 [Piromyces finnis]|uniref:Uncharacterized protein n=1 Tax=Piromyces finnis TaxID=1754191 RepID=A0A1Y1V4K7_9FUNG|nr:hypothetical protein BCR36DRAFT_105957 [Piromyces finnis]|eukprot:ORX46237.1 hypothetical protein BCR36DRAFT_105957 [Piromyces finnis]